MSFGRGGPRIYFPWWTLPIVIPVYLTLLVVVAPFWLLGKRSGGRAGDAASHAARGVEGRGSLLNLDGAGLVVVGDAEAVVEDGIGDVADLPMAVLRHDFELGERFRR